MEQSLPIALDVPSGLLAIFGLRALLKEVAIAQKNASDPQLMVHRVNRAALGLLDWPAVGLVAHS
jgi:hypothetical protein